MATHIHTTHRTWTYYYYLAFGVKSVVEAMLRLFVG